MSYRDSMLYKIYLGVPINTWSGSFGLKRHQAQALGIADRNVGKVSGRAEFYQRLKALSVAPVKEPTSGAPQANYHFPHYRHRDRKSPS
jgi:hypothetical protein